MTALFSREFENHEITFQSLLSFCFCPWFPFFFNFQLCHPSFSFSFFYFYPFFPSSLLFLRLPSMLQTPRYSHSSLSFTSRALSLSLPLSSFICHFTRPFVPLFRAISVQRRQANGDLSDCGAVLPLFLLFLLALTSAN